MKVVLIGDLNRAPVSELVTVLLGAPGIDQLRVVDSGVSASRDALPLPSTRRLAIERARESSAEPDWHSQPDLLERWCDGCATLIDCAERFDFDQPLSAARDAHVRSVAALLELLRRQPALRLVYLSSTTIAGDKRGLFTEFDLECGQRLRNAHEKSMFEAERMLRASALAARITIVRRSFVLDDKERPLAGLLTRLRGKRPLVIIGDAGARCDVITPAYLARCLAAIAQRPDAAGKTLHVVASDSNAITLGALVSAASRMAAGGPYWIVPPIFSFLASLLALLSLGWIRLFPGRDMRAYFVQQAVFDDFQARSLLDDVGISRADPGPFLLEAASARAPAARFEPQASLEHSP